MKWIATALGTLLAGCSQDTHNFVVDVAGAEKPVASAVVTICEEPPKQLKRAGKWFVGSVIAPCEGLGSLRFTHSDGTKTDCPIGYVPLFDTWSMVELRGHSCALELVVETYY